MVFGGLRRRHGGEVGFLDRGARRRAQRAITFIVFGAVLLGPTLGNATWAIVLYAVLSLTIVRMLPVAAAMVGTGARRPTVAFLGWFGPRGLASIVFAVLLVEEGGFRTSHLLVTTIVITVGLSIVAHGLTAAPLADRYAAWFAVAPEGRPTTDGGSERDPRSLAHAAFRTAPGRVSATGAAETAAARAKAVGCDPLVSERWQSGRMRRSRKPLRVVRLVEGSNPSLSAE